MSNLLRTYSYCVGRYVAYKWGGSPQQYLPTYLLSIPTCKPSCMLGYLLYDYVRSRYGSGGLEPPPCDNSGMSIT